MPELPDVETMRRHLARTSLHRPIERVEVLDGYVLHGLPPATLDCALRGRELLGTRRRGKYLFVRTEDAPWLLLHFGMTGALAVEKAVAGPGGRSSLGAPPPHTRVTLRFRDGGALHFRDQRKFGRVGLVDDPEDFAKEKGLGPDALAIGRRPFEERLAARSGVLKGVLLDQGFVAGLGNVYADEVALRAGIAPLSRVEDLSAEDRRALYDAMRDVLETAVRAHADPAELPEDWLLNQRRADGECTECGGPVAREKYQGRYTYWCPSCQARR